MRAKKLLIGLVLASYTLLFAQSLPAAPFCVKLPYSTQCWYYTYEECLRAARGSGGYCAINKAEVRQPSVVSPFCVVISNVPQCTYSEIKLCQEAAAGSGGVCLSTGN